MAEHHSKQTVQATYWCAKCRRPTLHNVADGRRAGCTVCMENQKPIQPQTQKPEQQEMF